MSDQLNDSSIHSSEDTAYVAVSGNNDAPVVTISTHLSEQRIAPIPPPPGHRYRYTTWYDLRSNEVKGSQLRHPRVRKGPEIKERIFYTLADERGRHIHHDLKAGKRFAHEKKMENWEKCIDVNLSYQELGHAYQMDNFLRILKRINRAERIQLINNDMKQLPKITFPRCRELNLRQNFFSRFKDLPKCPALEVLILSDNSVDSLADLHLLNSYPLKCLDLRRNPISFIPNYTQKVFHMLPNLKELDGIPQLTSDLDYMNHLPDQLVSYHDTY